MNISIDSLVKRFEVVKNNRVTWDSHWQENLDYCLPQKATVTTLRTPGTKLKTDLYDSTAIQSAQIFAAGLHSYLTNPSAQWFGLALKNKKLMDNFQVKGWLKECASIIFDYLNSSNFNQVIHEDYADFAIVGNSTLYEEKDPEDIITFSVRPVSEIYILSNNRGEIDTVFRHFYFTARQAYQKWGNNAGSKVLDAMESQKVEERIPFLHVVLPRDERNVRKKDALNMPYSSVYIEPTTKKILSEGGYHEFPFFIGRCYKTSDSEYAYSPASICLADIKMVNVMCKDVLEAAEKTLHPPLILPHDGYLLPLKTGPKGINYKLKTGSNSEEKIEVLEMKREIGISLEMITERRSIIQKTFFVDLFLMLASLPEKDRTATEIVERVNERMLILGPILGRLMHEKLDPLIHRTFAILMREKRLPPPPPIITSEDEYKVEYISPLAKAQKAAEMKSYNDLVIAVKALYEIDTTVVDNINSDLIIKKVAENNYVGDVLRSDEEKQAIRESRVQQQQTQVALEQIQQGGEGAKTVLEAEQLLREGGERSARRPQP